MSQFPTINEPDPIRSSGIDALRSWGSLDQPKKARRTADLRSSTIEPMPNRDLPDEELLSRARSETDAAASRSMVQEVFSRHHRKVAAWCLRFTGDRESAADLAQDVFLKAYTALGTFEGKSKFSTWLYTITRNHCFNHLKSARNQANEVDEEELARLGDASSLNLFEEIETRESRLAFRALVNQVLSDTERRAMVLHYVEELPMATVTRMLALNNPSGAKAHIVSAKRKLQKALARWRARQERLGETPAFPFPGAQRGEE